MLKVVPIVGRTVAYTAWLLLEFPCHSSPWDRELGATYIRRKIDIGIDETVGICRGDEA